MILFSHEHVDKVRSGRKTETRRCWKTQKVREGSVHYEQRSFRPEKRFARIRILKVWEQNPREITPEQVKAEGFESKEEFIEAYYKHYPEADAEVERGWRKHLAFRFEVIELLDELPYP